jgi:hypothetical protein
MERGGLGASRGGFDLNVFFDLVSSIPRQAEGDFACRLGRTYNKMHPL